MIVHPHVRYFTWWRCSGEPLVHGVGVSLLISLSDRQFHEGQAKEGEAGQIRAQRPGVLKPTQAVASSVQRPMIRAESRMSRRSPVCFSSGINRDRMGEDGGAANRVAALLDSAPAHQIHPAAKTFLEVFLEGTHFKKPRVASRQKFHQQIHVAASPARTARQRAKQINPGNAPIFTNGAHDGLDFLQGRRCCKCRSHAEYLARSE